MLRHSYNVLLKETQAKLLGLELDFERTEDTLVKAKIFEKKCAVEKEIEWIKDKIAKGEDPGVIIL